MSANFVCVKVWVLSVYQKCKKKCQTKFMRWQKMSHRWIRLTAYAQTFSRLFIGGLDRCWLWEWFSPAAQQKDSCAYTESAKKVKKLPLFVTSLTLRCWHLSNTLPVENWTNNLKVTAWGLFLFLCPAMDTCSSVKIPKDYVRC